VDIPVAVISCADGARLEAAAAALAATLAEKPVRGIDWLVCYVVLVTYCTVASAV
jgi:hypothetical protein